MNIHSASKREEVTSTESECIAESSLNENACNGWMGVPITFLDKFNPDQFTIIGMTKTPLGNDLRIKIYDKQIQHNPDGTTQVVTKANDGALLKIDAPKKEKPWYEINGEKFIAVYPRILIKRKKKDEN